MEFYEMMNDLDVPISDIIKKVNGTTNVDFPFFQLTGCMHEQVFGQRGNEHRISGVDWREIDVFDRTVILAINIEPGEGGDQGLHLLFELIRLAHLMDEDDFCLSVMSGIRSYSQINPDIWLKTAGYFWTWLQKKSIAYDAFTVMSEMRPGDIGLFYNLICTEYHTASKEDDEVRALLAQCTNDYFFTVSGSGKRGQDSLATSSTMYREISERLIGLNKTFNLPDPSEYMNS